MRALGNTVAGGVVGDVVHGLPMEEREDRDVVRARREAKRGQLLARSPFATLAATKADAHESQRQATRDVDEQLETEKFTTPDFTEKNPSSRRGYRDEDVETIRRLYGEGRSQREIAEHLGGATATWTQSKVSKVMRVHDIERRPRGGDTRTAAEAPEPAVVDQAAHTHETPAEPATAVVELPAALAVLETTAALAAVPAPALAEHPDVRAFLAALQDALDTSAEVVLADVRNATDRLRARSVANRRTAAASRGRAL